MIQLIILKLNKYVLKWYLYKDTILIKQYIASIILCVSQFLFQQYKTFKRKIY